MKLILKSDNDYILRIDKNEEFIESLREFCNDGGIKAGYFSAVGAMSGGELAYYDVDKKEYSTKEVNENLEILSIIGNVAVADGEITIHAHGIFGREDLTLLGGHINKLIISTIAEIHLTKLEGEINRRYDEETGLKIMQ